MPPPLVYLPSITVQESYLTVISDIKEGIQATAEDIWVSCYSEGQTSVHGRVRITASDSADDVELEASRGVQMAKISNTETRVACTALRILPTPVQFPSSTKDIGLQAGIESFDISQDGSLAVVGSSDGKVKVIKLTTAGDVTQGIQTDLRGNLSAVTDVKFFPSGEVVLTASVDMSLRVFSASDGRNVRTLTGHTRAVSCSHILGVGRNIISGSLDGTIRLWNVATAEAVDIRRLSQPLTNICVFNRPNYSVNESLEQGAESMETLSLFPQDLLAIATHTNGTASVVELGLPEDQDAIIGLLETGSSSLIMSVALDQDSKVVALGSKTGTVSLFSLESLFLPTGVTPTPASEGKRDAKGVQPFLQCCRSHAAITSLQFSTWRPGNTISLASTSPLPKPSLSLLVGSGDGQPFRFSFKATKSKAVDEVEPSYEALVTEEFAGIPSCEAAVIREHFNAEMGYENGVNIWIGSKDGSLRKYVQTFK